MEGKENSNIEFKFVGAEVLACYLGIIEDMILFRDMTDEAIIGFYRDIKKAIGYISRC